MSVPEQIPYVGYIANGQTTEFPITFDLHDPEFLVVTLNKEIPIVGAYTIDMNAKKVVFATAPNDNDQVELYRETELNRDIDYKSYDNSFRPEVVNYDLDTVMRILQEQNMIDAEIAAKIKGEIEWRRTHDANFDELSKMRDAQIFSGLKQYLDTILAMTNPNIFDGITAGIVFALDKKSVQTHIELIYAQLSENRLLIIAERNRAIASEADLQSQVNSIASGASKGYKTYSEMEADKDNILANSIVKVTNDPDDSKNGDYQYDGSTFTKSAYDPLTQAKTYADTNKLDYKEVNYTRINGNLITIDTKTVENRGIDQNFVYQFDTAYQSRIVNVISGTTLYLLNSIQDYRVDAGFGYAFFDKDPSIHNDAVHIVDTRTAHIDQISTLKYESVVVPSGAKYLVINTKFTTTSFSWAIHQDKFSAEYAAGELVVSGLKDIPLSRNFSNQAIDDLNNGDVLGDIYNPVNNLNNAYLNTNNELLLNGSSGWIVLRQPVQGSSVYYLKINAKLETPFRIQLSSLSDTVNAGSKVITTLEPTAKSSIYKLTTPSNAKALFIQVKFDSQLDITNSLSIQQNYFSVESIGSRQQGVCMVDGLEVVDLQARKKIMDPNRFGMLSNIYTEHQLINDWYVSLADKSLQPFGGWKIAFIPVTAGDKLVLTADTIEPPFEIGFYDSNNIVAGKQNITYSKSVVGKNVYVTVPTGANFIGINVYIVGSGNNLDIRNSLFVSKELLPSKSQIYEIEGNTLVDVAAREQLDELNRGSLINPMFRFKDKKVFALGDSITEGTQGGYVKYLNEAFGTTVFNYGSSGARTSRVVDIITAGAGLPRRDSATSSWTWPVKDFTDLKCVTLMIGSNDVADMPMGSIDDIPTSNLLDHSNPLDYWALFPNNYISNIALVIEFIKSKAPKSEIHIIAPPFQYNTTAGGPQLITQLIPHLEAVTHLYGVHLIYATYESGLSFKLMNSSMGYYSYDGLHLNTQGNEVFGKFVANKVLSVG